MKGHKPLSVYALFNREVIDKKGGFMNNFYKMIAILLVLNNYIREQSDIQYENLYNIKKLPHKNKSELVEVKLPFILSENIIHIPLLENLMLPVRESDISNITVDISEVSISIKNSKSFKDITILVEGVLKTDIEYYSSENGSLKNQVIYHDLSSLVDVELLEEFKNLSNIKIELLGKALDRSIEVREKNQYNKAYCEIEIALWGKLYISVMEERYTKITV